MKTTQQTEELAKQAAAVPSLRAELDALRRRHASALELMGERDEEVRHAAQGVRLLRLRTRLLIGEGRGEIEALLLRFANNGCGKHRNETPSGSEH